MTTVNRARETKNETRSSVHCHAFSGGMESSTGGMKMNFPIQGPPRDSSKTKMRAL